MDNFLQQIDQFVLSTGTGLVLLLSEQKIAPLLTTLESILGPLTVTPALIRSAEKKARPLLLAHDVSFEQLSQIIELFPQHTHIRVTTRFKRYYPHKHIASHIVGYLGHINVNQIGRMGLEKIFEDKLRGQYGEIVKIINSFGKNLSQHVLKQALVGTTLQTTIDLNLQTIAEEVFLPEYTGALIIMESQTGAIRALVSRPSFDPNMFLNPLTQEKWQQLNQTQQPFINRVFEALYPPASLFKLVTLAAALEQKYIEPTTLWHCTGHVFFGGRAYHCNNKHGHGTLTTQQALAQSCNIPFFEVGKKIKIDIIAEYARRFGLGSKTHVLFPEKTGLIPTAQWKRHAKGEPWWPGETLSAMIGQTYLLATPIQVARMISAICEGYLVNPRILHDEPINKSPLHISQETRTFLKSSMKAVITTGTGRGLKQFRDIELYAKTGTAQIADLTKRDLGQQYLEHGWFVGNFTYKNEQPLTIAIILEHVGSARIATHTAKNFLTHYQYFIDTGSLKGVLEEKEE